MREQEAERQEESDTGERGGIKEHQSGIQDPTIVSADHTAHGTTIHKLQQFNWARDVDNSLGLSPADPDLGDATPEPTLVNLNPSEIVADAIHPESAGVTPAPVNPNPVTPDNPTPTAFAKRSPIISVSPIPPIAYEPRDFSALCSSKQNPWGSLNHCRRHPYMHPHVSNSRLEALNHSNLLPPHPRHSVSSVSSLRHSFNMQSNSYSHQPLTPVNIIQTTQYPHGISATKLKITKTILNDPASFIESREQFHMARCTCGNIIPHRRDWDSWRSTDRSRRTFKRGFDSRFRRRFSRRFWDWGGGVNGVGALPLLAVPEVPWGPFPVCHCCLVPVSSRSSCHTVPFQASASC